MDLRLKWLNCKLKTKNSLALLKQRLYIVSAKKVYHSTQFRVKALSGKRESQKYIITPEDRFENKGMMSYKKKQKFPFARCNHFL